MRQHVGAHEESEGTDLTIEWDIKVFGWFGRRFEDLL